MRFTPTNLTGSFVIDPERHEDERGWFARSFCTDEFAAHGLPVVFPQHNVSFNRRRGTLRGLHYQTAPYEEPKVVRCVRGAVFDAIVDIRPDSATWGMWVAYELNADNGRALYVPPGFAHGFQTLADDCEVLYLMGQQYVPGHAAGIRYDDPSIGLLWPLPPTVISERDLAFPAIART
jgi:dTDP-4-dehydrorhamnose 3,5-epimerase